MIQEGIFSIEYERGRMRINLSAVLPCPKTEFKKLLSAVDLSADSITYADELNAYIRQQYEAAKIREESEKLDSMKKEAAKEAKKFFALNEVLVKIYSCEAIQDAQREEEPKMKKDIVYSFCAEYGKQTVKPYLNGYSFQLAGIDFSVYRRSAKEAWIILCSDCGMQCATADKKNQIIEAVKKILPRLKEARSNAQYKTYVEHFDALMIEAGYKEAQPEEAVNDEQPDLISEDPASTKAAASTEAQQEKKQEAKPEAAQEAEAAEKEDPGQPEAAEEDSKPDLPEEKDYSIIDSTIKDRIINAFMRSRITAEEMHSLLEEAYAAATVATEKTITPQEAAGQPQSEKSTAHDIEAVCTVRIDCRAFYTMQEADSTAGQEKDPAAPHTSRAHNSRSRKPEYMDSS